jgi:hypothetical protein
MPRGVAPQDLPQSERGRCILLFSRHILSSIWAAGRWEGKLLTDEF